MATPTRNDQLPTDPKELHQLLERARKGDATTVPLLRQFLQRTDSVEVFGANLALQTEETLIGAAAGKDLFYREALRRQQQLLREELGGPKPTPIERVLVERIVTCWLQLQDANVRYHQAKNLSINQAEYQERGIDRAHKRFLSAVKTLATVRRLAVPVLIGQVNIAKKQVNNVASPLAAVQSPASAPTG